MTGSSFYNFHNNPYNLLDGNNIANSRSEEEYQILKQFKDVLLEEVQFLRKERINLLEIIESLQRQSG